MDAKQRIKSIPKEGGREGESIRPDLAWRENEDQLSMESGRFLPIKVKEGGSHFEKDDLFFFLCNCSPERAAIGCVFLFRWKRGD